MTPVHIPRALVEQTVKYLQEAGARRQECVVLWLAERRAGQPHKVREVFRPRQTASSDFFRIDSKSMTEILEHLGDANLFIPAQVHSHPQEAFHSPADDRWAIVRHVGALSLVLPYFARKITPEVFVSQCAAFRLTTDDRWAEMEGLEKLRMIEVT